MQRLLLISALLLGCGLSHTARADESPSFAEKMKAMRPRREAWQSIPWLHDLGAARQKAAESGRPIFLWAMNGNPLGCT